MSDFEQSATLSRQRYLLECAEQERRDLERAPAFVIETLEELYPEIVAEALAAARREGAAEMRERAAQCVDPYLPSIAAKIRALPLTPEGRE